MGVEQSDGSYKLTYDAGSTYNLGGRKITVNVQTRGGNSDWLANSYSYGDLLGMIEFYDAENLVFYDGAGYADHCQLKLIKTVGVPAIQTVMTAPNYEERYESTATIQGDMYIPLLANEYTTALGANNPDFVALSDTIRILEGARNSVLPAGSDPFYQPYQIDASIEFNWSTEKAAYTGDAPYGWYKKPALCPVLSDGVQVQWKISGAQQQQNKSAELYDQQGQYGQHLPCSLPRKTEGSAVLSALPTVYEKCTGRNPKFLGHHQEQQRHRQVGGHGRPTIQSVTAPAGTYASGQHVPITVTFNEFVDLRSAIVTINGKEYTAAALSMNNYGVTAMLWYPVQDTDATTVTVNGMTGVKDVFGHTLDTTPYQKQPDCRR